MFILRPQRRMIRMIILVGIPNVWWSSCQQTIVIPTVWPSSCQKTMIITIVIWHDDGQTLVITIVLSGKTMFYHRGRKAMINSARKYLDAGVRCTVTSNTQRAEAPKRSPRHSPSQLIKFRFQKKTRILKISDLG